MKTERGVLTELLEKVLHAGGDELEIDYRDRKEWFTAFNGPVGFGIGSLDTEDAKPVFEEMDKLKKRKQVSIGGRTYALRFREFESFGETVYRIQMKEIRSNKSVHRIADKSGSRCPTMFASKKENGELMEPDKIMDGLSKELNSALKAMAKARDVNEREVYSRIVKNLCESFGVFLNLASEMMSFDSDEDLEKEDVPF